MDFEILKQQIEDATKKAFIEMHELHGSENIYAFALYSDEGAMTVCPSTNTLTALEAHANDDEQEYYKFEPAEWKYEMQGANDEFNKICKDLRDELYANEENEAWFDHFQKSLFDTCIDVLEKLKSENFFQKIIGKDIFLFFTISDYDFKKKDIKAIVEKLNDNSYKDEYLAWMKSW
ncbi:DUF4303 domain-containing protein [Soonwooa sp.]|uniref:DUF4303 domain-containing protein n=1 Tax=Soonwooa sp. TaxID=1938592 RepID=UPI002613CCBA|nr:DUF4303 domain-containing protein [Soonwooa sp.]